MEQLDIFKIIDPNYFCENEKINELVSIIEKEMKPLEDYGVTFKDKTYEIWDHVPKTGKRLCVHYNCDLPYENPPSKIEQLLNTVNLQAIFDYSKNNELQLSISPTPYGIYFMV